MTKHFNAYVHMSVCVCAQNKKDNRPHRHTQVRMFFPIQQIPINLNETSLDSARHATLLIEFPHTHICPLAASREAFGQMDCLVLKC